MVRRSLVGAWDGLRGRLRRLRDGEAGFTLLEVTLALSILMFLVMALGGGILTSTEQNAISRDMTAATGLAQRQMTKLQAIEPGSIKTTADSLDTTVNARSFKTKWSATGTDSTKDVTVVVTWTGTYGQKTVQLVGFVGRLTR